MTSEHKYRYSDFADKHLAIHSVSGVEAMVRCPVHEGAGYNCQFNLERGLWTCFRCGEGGNLKKLCKAMGISVVAEPEPDLDELIAKLKSLEVPTRRGNAPDPLPESMLKRYAFPNRYWSSRGFTEETIKAFDLGYDVMHNAATIPIRNENHQLLGVISRYLDEDVELRYKYPKGFKRSRNLFGSWFVEHSDSDLVVICEGAVDAMKVWQAGFNAVAQYGSSISPSQVRLLRRLGVGQVVLFYDNDKAGRKATMCAQGKKTRKYKGKETTEYDPALDLRRGFLVSVVQYKAGMKSDPGAMDSKMIRSAIKKAPLIV